MNAPWLLGPGEPKLVSVLVTAYNQEWVIEETLNSVSEQTYAALECVIVNDGSTDKTAEIIRGFAKRNRNLRVILIDQKNQGAQAARNSAVRASHGEFIQYLDGDDLLAPDKLKTQIDFFTASEAINYDVVYGDAKWIFDNGRSAEVADEVLGVGSAQDMLVTLLESSNFNCPFSYLSRRRAVERCGPWDRNIRINQDQDYFLRMACQGLRFAYLPGITGFYRRHGRDRISDKRMQLRAEDTLAILKSVESQLNLSGNFTVERRRALARAYRRVSYWSSASDNAVWRESLAHSLRLCPDLMPERYIARCLQRLVGAWLSEWILGFARRLKHQFHTLRRRTGKPTDGGLPRKCALQ